MGVFTLTFIWNFRWPLVHFNQELVMLPYLKTNEMEDKKAKSNLSSFKNCVCMGPGFTLESIIFHDIVRDMAEFTIELTNYRPSIHYRYQQ